MDAATRIETTLAAALERASGGSAPPRLAAAVRYAVVPGGARIRPRLCLAVAHACGEDDPACAEGTAAAIELLHCASLVHDDMPCFDDAATRRGKPSLHKAFGEPLALLAGDALIVMAFETLSRGLSHTPARLPGLVTTLTRAAGMPFGIAAGQAWECEPSTALADYHRAKTGSLFTAATVGGALAAGAAPDRWQHLGDCLGEAYQVADDIRDMVADPLETGKPRGQDALHRRPSAASEMGLRGAITHLERLLEEAIESIPPCPGQSELRGIIHAQAARFVPKEIARHAA
jgi:geranylgeranyl diphosphate synthase type II